MAGAAVAGLPLVSAHSRKAGEPRRTTSRWAPPPLSIIVLPFANLSNDPEEEYFADGITEDVITDLSRLPGSYVIARNTAFTYKAKPIDVRA
jgi:adenylate cyclase